MVFWAEAILLSAELLVVRGWNYPRAIAYLNSFLDYERIPEPRQRTTEADMDRFRALLSSLNNPHLQYPVIHIVGTKGKGSTAALLASILQSSGYRVGLYTSPHLISVRERIAVNGKMVGKREFAELMAILRENFAPFKPFSLAFRTVFEHLTAAAFLYFMHKEVDIAVVEAGMGARLDATIVVEPQLVVLTPIGLDHTQVLGSTISEIAADKAYAIKPGCLVVSAPQSREAEQSLMRRAEEVNADLYFAPAASRFSIERESLKGTYLRCRDQWRTLNRFFLPLAGRFQLVNLSTVLTALEVLKGKGLTFDSQSVRRGIRRVHWPGRLEVVSKSPLIVIDGAHNELSIKALVEALKSLEPSRRWLCLFSSIVGKPTQWMVEALLPISRQIYLTPLVFPKGVKKEVWEEIAQLDKRRLKVVSSVPEGIRRAMRRCSGDSGILITGSLYLVGEVMRYLRGLPPPPEGGGIDPL